jgi:hypothetical protein
MVGIVDQERVFEGLWFEIFLYYFLCQLVPFFFDEVVRKNGSFYSMMRCKKDWRNCTSLDFFSFFGIKNKIKII